MSLVELDPKAPNLHLRVYRRAQDYLILVWNQIPQIQGKSPTISVKCIETKKVIPIKKFVQSDNVPWDVFGGRPDDPGKVVCAFRESINQTDDDLNYYLTVSYDDGLISQSLKILPSGVFPDTEPEKRFRNTHSFLWDGTNQTWRKQEGILVDVESNGRKEKHFYPGFVQVPCPKCGYPGKPKE